MVRQSQRFLPICSLIISALGSTLTYPFIQDRTPPSGASPVRWNLAGAQPNISGGKIVYVINKLGSNDVNFATATSAVDAAFSTWRNANGSALDFLRTTDPSAASSGTTPITTDSINVVIWDENPSTPFKVPPLTYSSTVRLVDGTGY